MTTSIHVGQKAVLPLPPRKAKARSLTDTTIASSLKVERSAVKDTGMLVYKVDKNGKLQARRLGFSPDHRTLWVTTNKVTSVGTGLRMLVTGSNSAETPTKLQSIDISRMDHVLKGQSTSRFRLAQKQSSQNGNTNDDFNLAGGIETAEELSLSLCYRESNKGMFSKTNESNVGGTLETLDLVVPDSEQYQELLRALEDLLALYPQMKADTDRTTLLLEYLWIDMGKDLSDTLSSSEWLDLCDRLNVTLKKNKLSSVFKEVSSHLRKTKEMPSGSGLPLWAVVEMVNDVLFFSVDSMGLKTIDEHPLLRTWFEMSSADPVAVTQKGVIAAPDVSSVAFLSFIRTEQKEFRASLDDAVARIQVLNGQRSLAGGKNGKEDRLTQSRFFSFLLSDANDLLDPDKARVGSDDMTHPLSHYWICSSHDTYLNGWKKDSPMVLDEQMYLTALYRGARSLELDVWDYGDEPVIAPSAPPKGSLEEVQKSYLKVPVVLKLIRQFLLANPKSYPVILNIENHCNYHNQERLAHQIFKVLGKSGLIVVPDDTASIDEADLLPSPYSMRGKVLIMGKRPRVIQDGAKVINDDFDDENDEFSAQVLPNVASREMDESELDQGVVIGFDSAGPIKAARTQEQNLVQHSASELLFLAKQELEQAQMEAAQAEINAHTLREAADAAEMKARKLIAKSGLKPDAINELSGQIKSEQTSNQENDMIRRVRVEGEEGIEVQEFFGDGVETARMAYANAEQMAIEASSAATLALQELNLKTEKLKEAEVLLEESFTRERAQVAGYQRAAADARTKREDADYAKRRVEKVKQLLVEFEESASSAENIVATAMTEADISEKRASETEARAARAAAKVKEDRNRADVETRKEESLEREASILHEKLTDATNKANSARKLMDKKAAMIDRVNEQIKLMEQSSQYAREVNEQAHGVTEEKKEATTKGGRLISKHAAKIQERTDLSLAVQKASAEHRDLEKKRRALQDTFEKKAHQWKAHTELASKFRKIADRSTHAAEDLAEQAEEEREAANLRLTAREKAKSSISEKDAYRSSLEAQLAQAERAAEDAEKIANDARSAADALDHVNHDLPVHEDNAQLCEIRKADRKLALEEYQSKRKLKEEAEAKVQESKKIFESSQSVFRAAMRSAAKEDRKADSQLQHDKRAILAHNESILARNQAKHAMEDARYAQSVVTEKQAIVQRALDYNEKIARISAIPAALAKMTFLHTTKHRHWEKSLNLPNTHVHSFSQGVLDEMRKQDPESPDHLKEFTSEHICRTFASQKEMAKGESNKDPLPLWALGCQLVSLNFSIFDEHLLKADGRFRRNGSSGYVLKPDNLTHEETLKEQIETWTIDILCGSCLPNPESMKKGVINPFVKLSIYGGDIEGKKAEFRTKVVSKNGLNPIFQGKEQCTFATRNPSLAMCIFSVWHQGDHGEEFIAASSLPISCMREGIRSVALFDKYHTRSGQHAFASLLVSASKGFN